MGYESNGSGTFTIRKGKNLILAEKAAADMGFDIDYIPAKEQFLISFSNWKIYNSEDELKTIQEYFNGEFLINGDESFDIWKLVFEDGKVYHQTAKFVFDERKQLPSIEAIWK